MKKRNLMNMKILVMIFTASVVVRIEAVAQPIHPIPFASSGNTIELTVANTGNFPLTNVTIEAANIPSWLTFDTHEQVFAHLSGNEEKTASFAFSIDKSAPVDKEHVLRFVISALSGQSWTKEIRIAVSPPESFELFQNYPNSFNPSTTIPFQLPRDARVSLKLFNLLGQEVVTLIDGDVPVGYHEQTWNANAFASGVYIYQLAAADQSGKRTVARKTMLLVK